MSDFPFEARFLYERRGDILHVQTRSITNHEMRAILIGFWLTLDDADRRDHIAELSHYLDPRNAPPGASVEMARAIVSERDRGD